MPRPVDIIHHDPSVVPDDQPEMGHTTRHFMDLLGAPNEPTHGSSRLSLSLGSQVLHPSDSMQFRQRNNLSSEFMHQAYNLVGSSGEETCNPGDFSYMGSSSFAPFVIVNSVFLKPTQSILEEAINLGSKEIDLSEVKSLFANGRGLASEVKAELLSNGLISGDKHGFQTKISKLITLLEQVDFSHHIHFPYILS